MKCDTPLRRTLILCDLFNEIFKTGNWGVTHSVTVPTADRKTGQKRNGHVRLVPRYTSVLADRMWATSGMVATVITEDSTLALQQKVEDAGFNHVVVTPMGGDRVFLHSTEGEDIWHVFNNALHFFGMLFSNIHKWSAADVKYERGAWLRVYGVPVHAWNNVFSKCV